jgi:hypothetical protein
VFVCVSIRTRVRDYVNMYTYFWTYVYICFLCVHVRLHVCVCTVCVCVCLCVCISLYVFMYVYTGGPPYPRVIRSKTYRGYMKPRIIPNAIYNVIQRDVPVTYINTVKFN